MTTNSEFFETVVASVRNSVEKIHKTENKLAEVKRKIGSGVYAVDYVRTELEPEKRRLERKILSEKDSASEMIRKQCDEYIDVLREDEQLNPNHLNDDIRLLQMGVELTERDMTALIKRNENNGTMLQILIRYAKSHGIPTNARYVGNAPTIKLVNTLAESSQTVLKWSNNVSVFERLLGQNSELAKAFEGSDE